MMYTDKVVACLKVGGKILRENGDTVSLPFGSEYSILIKNLNSVRAQVKVSVDGTDATGGTSLVIPANGSMELERFIRNGNLNAGNRFKFIERTEGIEEHRGIGSDDGLIRVEAWREQVVVLQPVVQSVVHYWPYHPWPHINTVFGSAQVRNVTETSNFFVSSAITSSALNSSGPIVGKAVSDSCDFGITVPGSESNQQFHSVLGFPLEAQSTVIVLRLRGAVAGQPVSQPVTVDLKPTCGTCGKLGQVNAKFCGYCSAALVLV